MTINYNQRSFFASVFNDWGYVLDFSNAEFDSFTFNSVGVAIQSEYGLSKGKSLTKFLEMVDKSPADAIGKAKELLESCFTHILDDSGIEYTSRESMEQL